MPDFQEWMDRLSQNQFKDGECNCPDCMVDREEVDHEQVCADAIADLYPYWSEELPRKFDNDLGYLGRQTNLRYEMIGSQGYFLTLMNELENVHLHNVAWKEHFPDIAGAYCVDCGHLAEHEHELRIGGVNRPVCKACWDDYYLKCPVCNETVNKHGSVNFQPDFDHDKWEHGEGIKRMCRKCYTENFMKCQRCSMPVDEEHWENVSLLAGHPNPERMLLMYELNGQLVHEEDFWDNGDEPNPDDAIEIFKPWAVTCNHCIENAAIQCDKCEQDMLRWKARKIEWRGEILKVCQQCYTNRQVVKNYDYAVKPQFTYANAEPTLASMLYYGIEIEMEYRGKVIAWENGKAVRDQNQSLERLGQDIMDWWPNDFCYIKHDGTLEYGYEAVTHPFTWNWYQENQDQWIDFLLFLREIGFKAYYFSERKGKYTCALHVHMSKEAFTRMHLYKFVHFMYKKSTRPFINAIAERSGSQYADFQVADSKYAVKVGKDKKNASGRRHSAVNLLGGHAHEKGRAPEECQTCEVRIFQGYLEPVKFFKNMEFLQSLYEFTHYHSPKEMQVKKYLGYLLEQKGKFPAIVDFIKYNKDINSSYAYVSKLMKGV